MKKMDKIYCFTQAWSLSDSDWITQSKDWLAMTRLLFLPTVITFKEQEYPFSVEKTESFFKESLTESSFELTLSDEKNETTIQFIHEEIFQRFLIQSKLFEQQQILVESYLVGVMKNNGVFAFIRSYDEFLYHNMESLEERRSFQSEAEIQNLPKMKNQQGDIIVDCNQFAGYDVFYNGFCLTSCWRMYFSRHYSQIFPLEIIKEIQQVEQIKELEEGILLIELHKNPWQWDHPSNLEFQRLFRDQLGIDQIIWNNGVGVLREPFIEYAYGNHTIQSVQYQNERLQPTPKKQATHFVTRSYDLLNHKYHEKRVRGGLNAQAYFPWIDEPGMKMMNYIVLNPQYTLDAGIEAYEYYIRNYLEVDVIDERYDNYTVCLNIYIPKEFLASLPISELKEKMKDVHFSRLHKRRGKYWINVKKQRNHLRVYFVSTQELIHQRLLQG